MLLAEEVVNFKTESMKKMDDIIDKSEKYLADTCDHLDEDNDCIEQFEKTRE
jgi:predicted P-loop ATPase/GTPase